MARPEANRAPLRRGSQAIEKGAKLPGVAAERIDLGAALNRKKHIEKMRRKFDATSSNAAAAALRAELAGHAHEINEAVREGRGKEKALRTPKERRRLKSARFKSASTKLQARLEEIDAWLNKRVNDSKPQSQNKAYFTLAERKLKKARTFFDKRIGWSNAELKRYAGHDEKTVFASVLEESEHLLTWSKRRMTVYPWKPFSEEENKRMFTKSGRKLVAADREARTHIDTARRLNADDRRYWREQEERTGRKPELRRTLFNEPSLRALEERANEALVSAAEGEGRGVRAGRRTQDAARKKLTKALKTFLQANKDSAHLLRKLISDERPDYPLKPASVANLEGAVNEAKAFNSTNPDRSEYLPAAHELEHDVIEYLRENLSIRRVFKKYGPRREAEKRRTKEQKQRAVAEMDLPNKLYTLSLLNRPENEAARKRGRGRRGALAALAFFGTLPVALDLPHQNEEAVRMDDYRSRGRVSLLEEAVFNGAFKPLEKGWTPSVEQYANASEEARIPDSLLSRSIDWDTYPDLKTSEDRKLAHQAFISIHPEMLSAFMLSDANLTPDAAKLLYQKDGTYVVDSTIYDIFRNTRTGQFEPPESIREGYGAVRPDARDGLKLPATYPIRFSVPFQPLAKISDAQLADLGPRTLYQMKLVGEIAEAIRNFPTDPESRASINHMLAQLSFAQGAYRDTPTEETRLQYVDAATAFSKVFGIESGVRVPQNLEALLADEIKNSAARQDTK